MEDLLYYLFQDVILDLPHVGKVHLGLLGQFPVPPGLGQLQLPIHVIERVIITRGISHSTCRR